MGKHKQLTAIFESALRVPFDDDSRIVFFSDTHRGNNSWADEFARNQIIYTYALQHYFDAGFTYVEVGDGDELMKFKFVENIRLAHEQVYCLMQQFHQESRLYYIFGNHDIEYRNPETLSRKINRHFRGFPEREETLFENFVAYEGLVFTHLETGLEFLVLHGHQGELIHDRFFWFSRFLLRGLWRPLQMLGLQDPTSVSQNIHKRRKVELQLIDWVTASNQPLICGHTHQERFPKENDPPYFNTGSCIHPRWITCIEIKEGKIALIRWRIKPRKKGSLFVKRDVIGGPEKIKRFLPEDYRGKFGCAL